MQRPEKYRNISFCLTKKYPVPKIGVEGTGYFLRQKTEKFQVILFGLKKKYLVPDTFSLFQFLSLPHRAHLQLRHIHFVALRDRVMYGFGNIFRIQKV